MRSSLDWKSFGGILALLVTFALALPGVKAVRAEDHQAPIAGNDGPHCNATTPEFEIAQAGATIAQLQEQIAAQIAAQGGPSANTPILLNNRGYNYGRGTDLERIAADAERFRAKP
jgi:hypothetical protein